MRKLLAQFMVCLSLILGLSMIMGGNKAKAESGNESYENATKLNSNQIYKSHLESREDIDWYEYEVEDSTGVVWLSFHAPDAPQDFLIHIFLDDEGIPGDEITNQNGCRNSFESNEYSFCKGTKLYVRVKNDSFVSVKGYEYNLTMNTSKTPVNDSEWAVEDDGTYETANVITSSTKLCGIINFGKDEDWYKYVVKNDEPFSFKIQSTETDKKFPIFVYEDDDGIMSKEVYNTRYRDDAPELSYKKGDVIYIKVTGNAGIKYRLSVTDTAKSNFESINVYSILAGTNVVVGKAEAGATVNVKYGKKTYKAVADADGIYRVKTAKLKKGKKATIWQTINKKSSEKVTVKVVEKY